MNITHSVLVKVAGRWLRGTGKCSVVAEELYSYSSQQPDAIGFKHDGCLLIEVKISRSDFLRDKKKHHMKTPAHSVGDYRWYLTPPGLLQLSELPEGWGLLESLGGRVTIKKGTFDKGEWHWCDKQKSIIQTRKPKVDYVHKFEESHWNAERAMLFAVARKLSIQLFKQEIPR